jgi:AbrB family looped-hinge helix DNA binding protein
MNGLTAIAIPIDRDSTLSSQGQITLPVKVRKLLDLKPGEQLSWLVKKMKDGTASLIGIKKGRWPEDYYGIAKNHYKRYGGVDAYLKRERDSWD